MSVGHLLPLSDVWFVSRLPWVVPVVAVTLMVATATSGLVAKWLRVAWVVAFLLITSTGVILAGTLTPLSTSLGSEPGAVGSCDFTRVGLPDLAEFTRPADVLGNVLMFIPLGFAIALAPRSRRKTVVLLGACALPFLIETTQLLATPLRRGCQSADVTDNLTGLVLGLAAGTIAARLWPRQSGVPTDT
mgnify:CR=1 FL=1